MLKLKLQFLATWFEELTHLKRPWCWERLRAGGEGDNRGWDGWMASLTQWTWVWVNSGSWWWIGRPGVLWSMGLQRVEYDWARTELILGDAFRVQICFQVLESKIDFLESKCGEEWSHPYVLRLWRSEDHALKEGIVPLVMWIEDLNEHILLIKYRQTMSKAFPSTGDRCLEPLVGCTKSSRKC